MVQGVSSAAGAIPDLGFARAFGAAERQAAGDARRPSPAEDTLSADQQRRLRQLQQIDRRVRAHELAHLASGDGVVRGGPSYVFEKGPDGHDYAVAGEIPIDATPARTAEATIEKARAIQRAALAPADPSTQDRQVAARAFRMESDARAELARERAQGSGEDRASPRNGAELYRQVAAGEAAGGLLLAVA